MKFASASLIASTVLATLGSAQSSVSAAGSVEPTGPLPGTNRDSEFGLLTIHSGNTEVHQRTVVVYNDGTLGIDASKNVTTFRGHLNIADHTVSSVTNTSQVLVVNKDNYLQLVEEGESEGTDREWTTKQQVLALDGKQQAVVCPSDSMRIVWKRDNSTNCDGGVGAQLFIVSS